ncbi:hypothetical protein LLEC1_03838, partial [Akanthomyces lecanii]
AASKMDLPSLFYGIFLGVFPFTFFKVVTQTEKILRRSRALQNSYLYMIWIEAIVNFVFALVTILYLEEVIPGSFMFYFGTVTLWAIQTQLLSQIIANRVSIIMVNRHKAKWLRLGLFLSILAVNIVVYVVWIPAHMPNATGAQRKRNEIFEKAEKTFFLVVDLGLNLLFLYLVRFRLIAGGLSKYWRLLKMNAALVVISTAMDAALLGMLSLPNSYVYVQFAPLVYITKLYIELVMASLIAKIVRSQSAVNHGYPNSDYGAPPRRQALTSDKLPSKQSHITPIATLTGERGIEIMKADSRSIATPSSRNTDDGGHYKSSEEFDLSDVAPAAQNKGILMTTTTTVVAENITSDKFNGHHELDHGDREMGVPQGWTDECENLESMSNRHFVDKAF